MCIVVDINTLAPVFSDTCKQHADFRPVRDWILAGRGFLVFGGTKFKRELKKAAEYLRLIRLMKDAGQAVAIRDDLVDEAEVCVKRMTKGTKCDDSHLIALLGISRCPLICSKDSRSYAFIRDRKLYPRDMARVRIYSSGRNKGLLRRMQRSILRNQA